MLHLRVDVLDLDSRLVDQNANRKCNPAQSHDVDCVPRQVQHDERTSKHQGDVQNDDDHASYVPQEEQHHQACEPGAQGASTPTLSIAPPDDWRFVEFVCDLHVVRERRLESSNVGLYCRDHRKRRRVGPFTTGRKTDFRPFTRAYPVTMSVESRTVPTSRI